MEKKISREFQIELLELADMAANNDTDNLTLTLEYEKATVEVDITFKLTEK